METADVVIAGGGIMGCALAYQLARRNVDVLLLERETLGSQSTGKCAGGVNKLGPAAVVDGQAQRQSRVLPANANVLVNFAQHLVG